MPQNLYDKHNVAIALSTGVTKTVLRDFLESRDEIFYKVNPCMEEASYETEPYLACSIAEYWRTIRERWVAVCLALKEYTYADHGYELEDNDVANYRRRLIKNELAEWARRFT